MAVRGVGEPLLVGKRTTAGDAAGALFFLEGFPQLLRDAALDTVCICVGVYVRGSEKEGSRYLPKTPTY